MTKPLGEIADIVMGQSPSGETCNQNQLGVPLLNGPTEFGPHHPTPAQFTVDPLKVCQIGDILFCVRGSTTGRMNWADREYAIGRGIAAIRHKEGLSYQPFLRALIEFKLPDLLTQATGSTFPNVSYSQLTDLVCPVPPLPIQRAIAHILGTLDDKIELNRQMNATLEAIARALFQSWFVDLDPVRAKAEGRQPAGMDAETAALFPAAFVDSELGKIPKGWRVQRLEQHLDAVKGLSYSGSGLSENLGMPMHNLNSIYEGGGYKFEGIKFYIGDYKEHHLLYPGDIIVANTEQGFDYLLIGYPAIVPKHFGNEGIFSHHLFRVRPIPGSPLTTHFIYHLLMTPLVREQVVACTNGTTVNMLNVDGLRTPRFILPSAALIQSFESIVAPMFTKVEENYKESLSLAALRDALLPKLISGEIRIKDAEKLVGERL
jgi:type I restriction enzyme S subunit